MEVVSTILTVVQKIMKAAETARYNQERCADLAHRVATLGDILRADLDSTMGAGGSGAHSAAPQPGPLTDTAQMRKPALERLQAALEKALKLVESCQESSSWVALLTSEAVAVEFQRVEVSITNCVGDLGFAYLHADRLRARRATTGTGLQQGAMDGGTQMRGEAAITAPPGLQPQRHHAGQATSGHTPSQQVQPGLTSSQLVRVGLTSSQMVQARSGVTSSQRVQPWDGLPPSQRGQPGLTSSHLMQDGAGLTSSQMVQDGTGRGWSYVVADGASQNWCDVVAASAGLGWFAAIAVGAAWSNVVATDAGRCWSYVVADGAGRNWCDVVAAGAGLGWSAAIAARAA
ncbi:hypothetical protein ACQ4PT_000096 [Festuca glaucescens]